MGKGKSQPKPRVGRNSQAAQRATPSPDGSGDSPRNRFPIVGVGASAGGLEAFTQLLEALSADPGVAIVFVQHLAPTRESALKTLLSRDTPLPVRVVEDGMAVERNHIYVIPPDRNMAILSGKLNLFPREEAIGKHLPI